MKKIVIKNYLSKEKNIIIILTIISLISCLYIVRSGIIVGHDLEYHLSRIVAIANCLKCGNIKALVHPGFYGYGYANGLFYSNLFLYIPAIIYNICNNSVLSFKVFVFLFCLLTSLSMYYSVKKVTKNNIAAMISSIIYITSPYHVVDMMTRAAIGEFMGFAFVPLVILGLYEILFGDEKKWYIFTLGFVFLLNTHVISTVLMFIIIIAILLWNYNRLLDDKKRILSIIKAGILGVLLALFFIAPFFEQYLTTNLLVNSENTNTLAYSFDFQEAFCGLLKYKTRFFPGGVGFIFVFVSILWAYKFRKTKENKKYFDFINICIVTGIIVLLCSTKLLPWNELSKVLGSIQFTYRLYVFVTAFISFASGIIIYSVFKNSKRFALNVFLILSYCLCLCLVNQFLTYKSLNVYWGKDYTINDYTDFSIAAGEYLPEATDWSLIWNDKRVAKSNNENLKVSYVEKEGKMYVTFKNNTAQDTYIDVPYIYYKGYSVQSVKTSKYYKTDYGYNTWIRIYIGGTKSDEVVVWYKGTKITRISYAISLISWVGFIGYFVLKKFNFKLDLKEYLVWKK